MWTRGLRDDAALVEQLSAVFSRRRTWDRFWALLARGWNVAPLVALLPEDARGAWFAFWAQPGTTSPPQQAAALLVSRAVGRLVAGESGAAEDPEIAKLRGPRLVGDVIGGGPAWRFGEFDSATPEALWAHLVRQPETAIDLAEATLLIAKEEYPDLDLAAYLARFEDMGAEVRRLAGPPRIRIV